MARDAVERLGRAYLGNLRLPANCKEITFSGFSIKKSPNCYRWISIQREDGTKETVLTSPTEDELEPGYPVCEYYLELDLGKGDRFAFEQAEERLVWALTRLRLYKPGMLWGAFWAMYYPPDDVAGCSLMTRVHTEAPYTRTYSGGYGGVLDIKKDEVKKLVNFVNGLPKEPPKAFATAIDRYHLYFDRDSVTDRAIDLMIVLESLFSDDNEAIAYKIALRAAFLIEHEAAKRKALFGFLKKAYGERSHIVHGKKGSNWFEKTEAEHNLTNIERLEGVVQSSLRILLRQAQQGTVQKPANIDTYLLFT